MGVIVDAYGAGEERRHGLEVVDEGEDEDEDDLIEATMAGFLASDLEIVRRRNPE